MFSQQIVRFPYLAEVINLGGKHGQI